MITSLLRHVCRKLHHGILLDSRLGLGGSSFRVFLAPRISSGHFFLAIFVRVTQDGQSDRGTTRSLGSEAK